MSNTKVSQLPVYTGDTAGSRLIMNDAGNNATYTVSKEILFSNYTADSSSFNTRINAITSSVTTNTGSLTLTSSFNSYTSSINTFSSSILTYTSSINNKTGSFTTTSSFNSYTASVNLTIADILAETSSINNFSSSILTYTSSINNRTGSFVTTSSFNSFTASVSTFSASFDARINAITSSVTINTGSFATTASFNSYTSSINLTIADILAETSSINNFSSSILTYTSSINNRTGSFVTTSSFNSFTSSVSTFSASFDARINSLTESVFTHVVTSNGASNYIIDGVAKPILSFVPGAIYKFDTTAVGGSHPFRFSTSPNGPTQYTTGVTSGSNYIQIEVNYDTPTLLYYYCTIHSGMGNEINVLRIENLVTTASFNNFSYSINSYTASLNARTSSFATTGSNTFIGNQIITGSLILSSSAAVELTLIGNQTISGSLILSGSIIVSGSAKGNIVSMSIASSTASLDMSMGSYFTLTLANTTNTHITATNITPGISATLLITTGTNSSASLASILLQPSGSYYTASLGSGKKDVLSLVAFDSTNMYVVSTKAMQ